MVQSRSTEDWFYSLILDELLQKTGSANEKNHKCTVFNSSLRYCQFAPAPDQGSLEESLIRLGN